MWMGRAGLQVFAWFHCSVMFTVFNQLYYGLLFPLPQTHCEWVAIYIKQHYFLIENRFPKRKSDAKLSVLFFSFYWLIKAICLPVNKKWSLFVWCSRFSPYATWYINLILLCIYVDTLENTKFNLNNFSSPPWWNGYGIGLITERL